MLLLLIDENFDQRILRGLRLEAPHVDYVVVQETKLKGLRDPILLAWAADKQGCIPVSRSRAIMLEFVADNEGE